MNWRQSFEFFNVTVCHIWAVILKILCSQIVCGSSLCSDYRPNRPKKALCHPNIIFHLGVWRGGALLFVCVMYQCVISDRGSVCCAIDLLSDSSFCSADRQWWRAASGRHWLQTSDTVPRSQSLLICSGWTAGDKHAAYSRFRAGSTPLNWTNLEWTQAQLKTSQLTESNFLYILLSML